MYTYTYSIQTADKMISLPIEAATQFDADHKIIRCARLNGIRDIRDYGIIHSTDPRFNSLYEMKASLL